MVTIALFYILHGFDILAYSWAGGRRLFGPTWYESTFLTSGSFEDAFSILDLQSLFGQTVGLRLMHDHASITSSKIALCLVLYPMYR